MTICIICPNCHGTKYVSQPHKVPSYPCPVCGAHGWVDVKDIPNSTVPDTPSDQHDDKHDMRCDRVRELEAMVENKDLRIADLEAQRDIVRKYVNDVEYKLCFVEGQKDKLRRDIEICHERYDSLRNTIRDERVESQRMFNEINADRDRLRDVNRDLRDTVNKSELLADSKSRQDKLVKNWHEHVGYLLQEIHDLKMERNRNKLDLELLDMLLKTLNPIIRGHRNMAYSTLGKKMDRLCQDVIEFRRKHNIEGQP